MALKTKKLTEKANTGIEAIVFQRVVLAPKQVLASIFTVLLLCHSVSIISHCFGVERRGLTGRGKESGIYVFSY